MPTIDESLASWTSAVAERNPADASLCEFIREKLHGRRDPDLNWAAVGIHSRLDTAHAAGEISDAAHVDLGVLCWAAAILGRNNVKTLHASIQKAGDLLLLPHDVTAQKAGQQLREVIEALDNFEYDNAAGRLAELERRLQEPIAQDLAPVLADTRIHLERRGR